MRVATRDFDFVRHEHWVSSSPGLNPLNYKIWQHLKTKACLTPHPHLAPFQASLFKAAAHIDINIVRATIDDCQRRLKACIKDSGGHFDKLI